jgi:hypothetical protein
LTFSAVREIALIAQHRDRAEAGDEAVPAEVIHRDLAAGVIVTRGSRARPTRPEGRMQVSGRGSWMEPVAIGKML